MTSKELQKELCEFYRSKGIANKITVVPDGCYIYLGEGMGKVFVHRMDFAREPEFTWAMLKECDSRLH